MFYHQRIRRTLNSLRFLLLQCVNLLIMILVIYGMGWTCMQGYYFCYEIFGSVVVEDEPGSDQTFQVTETDTMWQVADRLEKQQLIVNRYSFFVRTKLMDPDAIVLRSGEYVLNTSMTYEEIVNQLTTSG